MSDVLDTWHSAPKPDELTKAVNQSKSEAIVPKSAIIDPLNATHFGGLRGKPTAVPYRTLRRMAQIPAIAAVINTRLNQVSDHAKRPKFRGDKGFQIALKDRDAKMSEKQRKRAKEIEDFFIRTGWEKNRVRKDNFNQFLRKITRDTLTIDVMTFEKVNKFSGALKNSFEVAEIWATDATTIELVINNPAGEGYEIPVYKPVTRAGIQNIGDIAYVQKVNGTVVAEFTEDELAFAIRNPMTDLDYVDFGRSELETLMEIVTGIVNGVRYNTSYFSHSNLPQGVMSLIGKYDDRQLESFKRHWKTLTEGAAGKWSVPVMAVEDGTGFQWTPFKNSNRDMEFNQFLEFLFNITCAVYQIDPNEVGFKSWSSGNSMTQSDNTAEKMDRSRDKGFKPLMTFLSDTFNSEIIDLIDDEFEFQWVGVDEEDEDKKLEREKTEMEMGKKTIAEIRKENDLEELLGEDGKPAPWTLAPANSQLIQVYMAQMNAQIQEEQGASQMEQQQQQGEKERQQALEDSDLAHKRQLEIMDKQHGHSLEHKAVDQGHDANKLEATHKQNMEAKKVDHTHQKDVAKMTAEQKKQEAKKKDIKKSIEDEFSKSGLSIEWGDY